MLWVVLPPLTVLPARGVGVPPVRKRGAMRSPRHDAGGGPPGQPGGDEAPGPPRPAAPPRAPGPKSGPERPARGAGRPDVAAKPALPGAAQAGGPTADHPQGDVNAMISMLETQMAQRPDNAEGWRMLGWSYLQTGRNADAAMAYGKAVSLDPNNAEY